MGKLEEEVLGESLAITFDGLIEAEGRNVVQPGEVGIQDNPLFAYPTDERSNCVAR